DTVDAAPCDPQASLLTHDISRNIPYAVEPHVAIDRHGNVLAAWYDDVGVSYALSNDDGMTFAPPRRIPPVSGQLAGDPTVATDGAGAFYVAWLSGGKGVFVNRVDAATGVAGLRVSASGPATVDKPWIAVDNRGRIAVAYTNTATGLVVAHS